MLSYMLYMCIHTCIIRITGTGKTFTMLGTSGQPGIMALTLNDLFKRANDTKDEAMYFITIAYLEVQ